MSTSEKWAYRIIGFMIGVSFMHAVFSMFGG